MSSIVVALGVGVLVGALGLGARYARWPAPATARPSSPAGAQPPPTSAAISASAAASASPVGAGSARGLVPTAASVPIPIPRAERFASDPAAAAACPGDMTLVEGEFCPALPYGCLRRPDEDGYRCAEYARGSRCAARPDPRRYCIDRYEWPNRRGENPHVFVDWHEAKSLCDGAGKRLCRRSEWILACEGPKRLPYPWGFVRQPSPCNIDRASIPFDAPAMMDESTRELELARLWQADRIGLHPDCVSAFGAYDMSGNVDEWTDNLADNPNTRYPSTLNGGYWGPVRDTCRLTTRKHGPTFRFYQVGFRCCADTKDGIPTPPPAPFVEREDDDEESAKKGSTSDAYE